MRSRMLPDSMRVGSFTIFCNPNSLIISSSLLCLLAVMVFDDCRSISIARNVHGSVFQRK